MSLGDLGFIVFLAIMIAATILISSLIYNYYKIRTRLREEVARASYLQDSSISDLNFVQSDKARSLISQIDLLGSKVSAAASAPDKALQLKLQRAGFFDDRAAQYYRYARMACAVALPVIFLLLISSKTLVLPFNITLLVTVILFAVGFYLPEGYLGRRSEMIQEQCQKGFPDFLDLIVVAAEAGMGLEAALSRVGDEMVNNYRYLGQNLHLAIVEIRLGQSLGEALMNFSDRVNVPEIRNFVMTLQQSREYGTSVADTLRVFSSDMRDRKLMLAEEKAMELPVKLLFPLALFMLPAIFIIALLPVYIRIKMTMMS